MPKFKETDDFVVDLRQKSEIRNQKSELDSQGSAVKEQHSLWWDFVQYNNAFLVVLVIGIMAFSGLVFASEDVRDATIGGKQVQAEGVDNSLLLATDIEALSMDFTITGIAEDDEQYVVSYSYVDLDVTNFRESETNDGESAGGAWQFVEKSATRRISKPFRRDLGLYLAGQLSQEARARKKELLKLQKQARDNGQTKAVQVTTYSGLIGKVLDVSATVFPNYQPVKKIELPTPPVNETAQARAQQGSADNLTNVYNDWVAQNPDLVNSLNEDVGSDNSVEVTDPITNEPPASPDGAGEIDTNTDNASAGEQEVSNEEATTEENGSEDNSTAEAPATEESVVEENTQESSAEAEPADSNEGNNTADTNTALDNDSTE